MVVFSDVQTIYSSLFLNTVSNLTRRQTYRKTLYILDIIILAFFINEFLLTMLTVPSKKAFFRKKFVYVELTIILQDIMQIYDKGDNEMHKFLRSLRLLRIFRMLRRVPGMYILFHTLQTSFRELLVIAGILLTACFFFAALMFYCGGEDESRYGIACPR